MLFDRIQIAVAEDLARREVVSGAEREFGGLDVHVIGNHCSEHLESLGDDFRPDSIAGDDGELDGTGHWTPQTNGGCVLSAYRLLGTRQKACHLLNAA
jgi:hypothetical protein